MESKFFEKCWLGFDCGQSQDYSALAIIRQAAVRYNVVYLERFPLGQSYPEQVRHVAQLMHRAPLDPLMSLAIDSTGVGRPIVDLAKEQGLCPIGVTITGGNEATWNDERTRVSVPKRDLISLLQVFAQNDRLKIAEGLAAGPILAQELQSFKVKINLRTAHDTYGTWREGEHDDLILSVAIALWVAEHQPIIQPRARIFFTGAN